MMEYFNVEYTSLEEKGNTLREFVMEYSPRLMTTVTKYRGLLVN